MSQGKFSIKRKFPGNLKLKPEPEPEETSNVINMVELSDEKYGMVLWLDLIL